MKYAAIMEKGVIGGQIAEDWAKTMLELVRKKTVMANSKSKLNDGLCATDDKLDLFEKWLRTVCFQRPTPEAYDLAKDAWLEARRISISDIGILVTTST